MLIFRYLTAEVLKSQVAVFLTLMTIFLSQKFVGILGDASEGSIPAKLVLSMIALKLPQLASLILPLSIFNLFSSQAFERHVIDIAIQESLEDYETSERKVDQIIDIDCFKYDPNKHDVGEDKQCTICHNEYESGEDLSILNCDHIFHTKCVEEWGLYKAECPLCRHKIPVIEKTD